MEILFFFLLFFFRVTTEAAHGCSSSNYCGNNEDISVRFPFRLQGQQAETCGYPGFNLLCSKQNIPVLNIPNAGDFYVRDINYLTEQVQIYDPDNCIPKRLIHAFNLSNSPFIPALHKNYTFLSCPTQAIKSRWTRIECMSNSTTSVLATSSESLVNYLSNSSCSITASMAVPVMWQRNYNEEFSDELDEDLLLTWTEPNCADCEVT
jgi:hypothetical protein